MRKYNYNFSNTLVEYQKKLKERYKYEYSLDRIESVLNRLQDEHLDEIYRREKERIVLVAKEDFVLTAKPVSV